MRIHVLTCVAALAAVPAQAQQAVELHPGHPIYHERAQEAGVAMALSITPGGGKPMSSTALCEELRAAAGLAMENGELRLETVFVVPRKGMAVEGLYLASERASGSDALVRGEDVARPVLDDIVSRAGIPPRILDETDVEHEIACAPGEPLWSITWSDLRRIGDEEPEAVIDRAHQRFLAVRQSVVEHNATEHVQEAQRATGGG